MRFTSPGELSRTGVLPTAGAPVALRAAGASDWGGSEAMLEVQDGAGVCLVAVPRGASITAARSRLEKAFDEPILSPNHLRVQLMRALREVEPRPYCFAAAIAREDEVWVAVTTGASVGLVRDQRIEEHTTDAATFTARPGDRVALVCARLDPLLRDADELGRLVAADDPRAAVVTLVEVGHLRGGTELSAVVAELASSSDAPAPSDEAELPTPTGVEDLLAALAPTLDALRRTPTPVPHPRRARAHGAPSNPPMSTPTPSAPVAPAPTPRPVAAVSLPPVAAVVPASPEPAAADPFAALPETDTLADQEEDDDPTDHDDRGAAPPSLDTPVASLAPTPIGLHAPAPAAPGRSAALVAGVVVAAVGLLLFVLFAFFQGAATP